MLRVSGFKSHVTHLNKIFQWSLFLLFWCRLQITVMFLGCLYGVLLSTSKYCWSFNVLMPKYCFQPGQWRSSHATKASGPKELLHELIKFTKTPGKYTEMKLNLLSTLDHHAELDNTSVPCSSGTPGLNYSSRLEVWEKRHNCKPPYTSSQQSLSCMLKLMDWEYMC